MNKILLDGQWQLTSLTNPSISVQMLLPGDIHSALFAAEVIPDPYWGTQETQVQWVSEHEWLAQREFELTDDFLQAKEIDLCLSSVDTLADITINDHLVLACQNMFQSYAVNVKTYLKAGRNQITIHWKRADLEAKARAERLPFPVPWAEGNNQIPHMNTLRKTQCHTGWDWGICLSVLGVYDSMILKPVQQYRVLNTQTAQNWLENETCHLQVRINIESLDIFNEFDVSSLRDSLNCQLVSPDGAAVLRPEYEIERIEGKYIEICASFYIEEAKRWWPAGYGEQPLYRFVLALADIKHEKQIGLRQITLDTQVDQNGSVMCFQVNGQAIMAKGANWIPLDAMPARQTPERYRQLLTDAKAANMNMIRVWGGGMYEKDIFYQLCDELGLLVWQDLMFACALYPSTDDFIADVSIEVTQQVRRLRDYACLALWCGDNEVIGAIGWYPESRANREKYVVNYDRLNRELQRIVEKEDPSRRFWASSPCNGELDFGDAWHDDDKGDMHFWDVWHSGKSFDAYQSIRPRFCSEFGYQSWPSLPTVKMFAAQDEWNITSPTFEQHQKNARGQSIITEMFTRYFRFPLSFEHMLYLSQVQQALAIKTAAEYWRSHKPLCRGVLYWQLNDCWPVSSWSSIEYSGRWKQLHYHAKRFFAPQAAFFVEDEKALSIHLINDAPQSCIIEGQVTWYTWSGDVIDTWPIGTRLQGDDNQIAWALDWEFLQPQRHDGFIFVEVRCQDQWFHNVWFGDVFKKLPLQKAQIMQTVIEEDQQLFVELTTDRPAFFVHLEFEGEGRFSDSSLTLLPCVPVRVAYLGNADALQLMRGLRIYHLAEVGTSTDIESISNV